MLLHTALQVATPPDAEPININIVRQHCRIDAQYDDVLLKMYLTTARSWAESYLNRALLEQTLVQTLSSGLKLADEGYDALWHRHLRGSIELSRAPVISISSVVLLDSEGDETTLEPSMYIFDTALEPCRLKLDWQMIEGLTTINWPLEHIQIAFVAGYGTGPDDIPAPIIHGILLLVAFLYERRGDAGGDMPLAAERLLAMHRIAFFGG